MNERHPLADEIKKWADGPDAWQWQYRDSDGEWENCAFTTALEMLRVYPNDPVRLIPKRSLIPPHLLPKGWEVERRIGSSYRLYFPRGGFMCVDENCGRTGWAVFKLLRHIDPEAKS